MLMKNQASSQIVQIKVSQGIRYWYIPRNTPFAHIVEHEG